jgi:thermitase
MATYDKGSGSRWDIGCSNGTSFASPVVAGVIALMLARNPPLSAGEVENILAYTADDKGSAGWDDE